MSLDSFQEWIVQTGLMVSLLILLILLIRRPFARAFGPTAAYALWSLPLIRLFLPVFTIPQSWVPDSLREKASEAAAAPVFDGAETPVFVQPPIGSAERINPPEAFDYSLVLMGLWLSVAVLWLSYQFYQQVRFKAGMISESQIPTDGLAAEIRSAKIQIGLRRDPYVRVSSQNIGPLVTGVINPLVILPRDFEQNFDGPQRNFALIHELSHIKRKDLWAALATLGFRAINWPNPLVHYAARKMRIDQEAACDAFVVKMTGGETAHSYAETLVKAAKQRREAAEPNSHLALSLTKADDKISKGD